MESLLEALKKGQPVNKKGYFNLYTDNIFGREMNPLFQKMFIEGSGDELGIKARAVHSSSMLSYNFFHWIDENHPFFWDKIDESHPSSRERIEYNQVLFEVKMKTIKGSPAPANMDVVLIGKDKNHILFIESKFTEYTNARKFELSKSYKDLEKWYYKEAKWTDIVNYTPEEKAKYKEGIKQLITHLFGIHSLFAEDSKARCEALKDIDIDPAKIEFLSLIFEPDTKDFEKEHEDFDNYKQLVENFRKEISNKGLKVTPKLVSYSELWNDLITQKLPTGLKEFLWERYMQFAQEAKDTIKLYKTKERQ